MANRCGIILCAGYGKRLETHTNKVPKPMVILQGKEIIHYIIDNFLQNEITQIIFVLGYKKPILQDYLNDLLLTKRKGSMKKINFYYVQNNHIERENGFSAHLGLTFAKKMEITNEYVISMGDHLYSPKFIENLFNFPEKNFDILLASDPFIDECYEVAKKNGVVMTRDCVVPMEYMWDETDCPKAKYNRYLHFSALPNADYTIKMFEDATMIQVSHNPFKKVIDGSLYR